MALPCPRRAHDSAGGARATAPDHAAGAYPTGPPRAPLLAVEDLAVTFRTPEGLIHAVNRVDLRVDDGEIVGLVGESGCGKSVTALAILGLVPIPPGRFDSGTIRFRGEDLLRKSEREMQRVRGNDIAMVFQDPMASLNPVFPVGDQIAEAVELHQAQSRAAAALQAVDALRQVGVPLPEQRAHEYPHQLSGGMRQRVMIAMALSCNPQLLIADEPTTALDVTIQAQILHLLRNLGRERAMAILLITHDLGVVAELVDRVTVMYTGRVVEQADVRRLFREPRHPYTQALFASMPRMDGELERLQAIGGTVPDAGALPPGCSFHPRCPLATAVCERREPRLLDTGAGHLARCVLYDDTATEEASAPAAAGSEPGAGR